MNKVKIQDFVGAYSRALNLTPKMNSLLTELMENIITKYEHVLKNVPVSEDNSPAYLIKPTNGAYSVEDFFLNRLMRNIWSVRAITENDIKSGEYDEHLKGVYNPQFQEVELNMQKLESQLKSISQIPGINYPAIKKSGSKKVIMHEFEHGLQTRFDNVLNFNTRAAYKKISDELAKLPQYSSILRRYEDIPKELGDISYYISTGVHFSGHAAKSIPNTYRDVKGIDDVNEILNESECLDVSGHNTDLIAKRGDDGNFIPVRNYESSNYEITNYGNLLKILLGSKRSFSMMYLNPTREFAAFNSMYNDIFKQAYGKDLDAMEIFAREIRKIKETSNEQAHLKLNATLAKCLERKAERNLAAGNINTKKALHVINSFQYYSMSNLDPNKRDNLEHIRILNNLRQRIKSNNNTNSVMNNNTATKEKKPMPTFAELKEAASRYELYVDDQTKKVQIRDNETKAIVTDKETSSLAVFANIWLTAAGIKWMADDSRRGMTYAFNEPAEKVYEVFTDTVEEQLERGNAINIPELQQEAKKTKYKYSYEIINKLFRSNFQERFLTSYLQNRTKSPTLNSLVEESFSTSQAVQNTGPAKK